LGGKLRGKILPVYSSMVLLAISHLASAQVASTAPSRENEGQSLDEIVVTAQKREQKLSDVGLTIAAPGEEQLQTEGVTDIATLAKVVPGFTATETPYGTPVFSMRGVNFNSGQLSAQPAVSTYVDEAALPYPIMTQGLLLDVERVEVLKGPQGTLFGQNATGGSINVIAAKPTDHFAAGFETSVNDFGQVSASTYVSGPVTETVRARVAASTTQFGAWQKCYYGCDNENGNANKGAMRALLDWTPTDRLKIAVNLNGSFDYGDKQAGQLSAVTIQVPGNGAPGLASYPLPPQNDRAADFGPGFNPSRHDKVYQAVIRTDLSLTDQMTATSITNYIDAEQLVVDDDDATALNIDVTRSDGTIHSFNQEFRLNGDFHDQGLNFILGGNYQQDRITEGGTNTLAAYSGLPPNTGLSVDDHTRYQALGFFANFDQQVFSQLTLTGGVRYTMAKERLSGCLEDTGDGHAATFFGGLSNSLRGAVGLAPTDDYHPGGCVTLDDLPSVTGTPAYLTPYDADLSQNEHNIAWRGGLNYKPTTDLLLYALVSRGFKAGGFPAIRATNATQIVPVKQEELTSYETGVKTSLFDHMLQFNAAVFYYQYYNKQFYTVFPSILGLIQTNSNIPQSMEKGADVDVALAPVRGLTLRGALTYINTDIEGNTSLAGYNFNYAPEWSGTFSAQYRFPVGGSLHLSLNGDGQVESSTNADLAENPQWKIAAYTVYDASIALDNQGDVPGRKGWQASVWVHNLTNKYYWTNVYNPADTLARFTGLPRTFGATVLFHF
jgi:iron complex outermembrane receptor protein